MLHVAVYSYCYEILIAFIRVYSLSLIDIACIVQKATARFSACAAAFSPQHKGDCAHPHQLCWLAGMWR